MIIDLFGGPGGWDEGLALLGRHDVIGLEWDHAACRTRRAAGHAALRADVSTYPPEAFGQVEGLIASPPCPQFSAAGKRLGAGLMAELMAAVVDALEGDGRLGTHRRVMARKLRAHLLATTKATRAAASELAWRSASEAALSVQPARWVAACRPRWVAMEQVPAARPLFLLYARELRRLGYSAWAGVLNAADYGVPQTRQRCLLLASLDGVATPPEPTHGRDAGETLFGSLEPWVTMAAALGWGMTKRPALAVVSATGEKQGGGGCRPLDGGSGARRVYREGEWEGHAPPWVVNTGRDWKEGGSREDAQTFDPEAQPAPTVDGKGRWHLRPGGGGYEEANRRLYDPEEEPAPVVAFGHDASTWAWERPATTVQCDARNWPPGHKVNQDDRDRLGAEADERYGDRAGSEAIRIEVWEAGVLQGFRPDYPWQGNRTKQFEQVGNAVPPPLAAAVLRQLIGAAGALVPQHPQRRVDNVAVGECLA